jgi:hypothetical protein
MENNDSFEDIRAMFREIAAAQKVTDKHIEELFAAQKETDRQMQETKEMFKVLAAERAERDRRLDRKFEELAAERAERDRRLDRSIEELAKSGKETRRDLAGTTESNGLVAEELVYNSLSEKMSFAGIEFDDIIYGLRRKVRLANGEKIAGEYDVVLTNGAAAAIIEVKYRVRKEDLDRLLDTRLPKFKKLFPNFKDFDIYLGLGGLSFEVGIEEMALKQGIGTLKFNGEVMEINDKNAAVFSG